MRLFKKDKRKIRRKRIRSKIKGTSERPRLAVFRSNKKIIAQIINDAKGETLVFLTSVSSENKKGLEDARNVGREIAKLAKKKKIDKIVFDRGGYIYTGKIRAVAEGAREGGLKF